MKPIFFLHVPKTAGRSVLALLQNWFSKAETLYGDWPEITPKVSSDYRFVAGHLYLRDVPLIQFRDHYKITILRDPMERATSHYYHLNEAVNAGRTLDPEIQHALDVGLEASIMDGSFAGALDTALDHLSSFSRANASKEENVGSAKTNLRYFDAVGFVDNFEPFVMTLCQRLGIPCSIKPHVAEPLIAVPHENRSRWYPPEIELTLMARKILQSYLEHDYWLYNYAKRTFGDFLIK